MNRFAPIPVLVKHFLENALDFEWSIQGLGMLRLYLDKEWRLHVWADEARTPDVSTIHDHPWGFRSLIISGAIRNVTYIETGVGESYMKQQIVCGPGGGVAALPALTALKPQFERLYKSGWSYAQTSEEIHESQPEDGSVSLIQRMFKADTEHAHVFYRHAEGVTWVSAEPRVATPDEVARITQNALSKWRPV